MLVRQAQLDQTSSTLSALLYSMQYTRKSVMPLPPLNTYWCQNKSKVLMDIEAILVIMHAHKPAFSFL